MMTAPHDPQQPTNPHTTNPVPHPAATHPAPAKPQTKVRRKKDRLPPLDWAATHGPITGALSATTGAAALAMAGAAAGMPGTMPLALGAVGALGHGIGHTIHRRMTLRTSVARCASWLLAGGWTTWALEHGPLTWACMGTLAGLGIGIGALASNAALHEEAAHDQATEAVQKAAAAATAHLDKQRQQLAAEWAERIQRITGLTTVITAVEFWTNEAGYSIGGDLPGGAVWTTIRDKHRNFAADARLPHGCPVEVEEGAVQGTFIIDITTVNIMSKVIDYPDDFTPLSILTGIPWGLRPSSDPVVVHLREACALIVGPPGSGKSTFLDGILAGFARCTDVLTWVIDLKAGAVGRPWARPWLEALGHAKPAPGVAPVPEDTRPGVDWIASETNEALLMLRAFLRINAARQGAYQELMNRRNTTLLPISADVPQIMLVIDEGAELLSASNSDPVMKELKRLVKKAMRTTRAMGQRLILTAIDGNVSAIGDTEVRKNSPVGVALTSGENATSNVSKLHPRARVDVNQLTEKGAGVAGQAGADGFKPTAFKTWRTSPNMVRACVIATNDWRATADKASAAAAGPEYADRWTPQRAGWLWNAREYKAPAITSEHFGDDFSAEGSTPATGNDSRRPTQPTLPDGTLNLSYKRAKKPQEDADELAARFMAEIDERYGTTTEPGTKPTTTPDTGGLNLSYKRDKKIDQRRAFIRDLVQGAGAAGIDNDDLYQALTTRFGPTGWDRSTVATWITKDCQAGIMHRPVNGRVVHGPKPMDEQAGE